MPRKSKAVGKKGKGSQTPSSGPAGQGKVSCLFADTSAVDAEQNRLNTSNPSSSPLSPRKLLELHGIEQVPLHGDADEQQQEGADVQDGGPSRPVLKIGSSGAEFVNEPHYRCSRCVPPVEFPLHELLAHMDSPLHIMALAASRGYDDRETCPVTINGRPMLFDNHVVFPDTVFGAGCLLFDETLHAMLAVDACGGIRLRPNHHYTVVRMAVSLESSTAHTMDGIVRKCSLKGTRSKYFSLEHLYRSVAPTASDVLRKAKDIRKRGRGTRSRVFPNCSNRKRRYEDEEEVML